MRDIIILGSGPQWERVKSADSSKEIWAVAKMLMLPSKPDRVDRLFSMDDVEGWLSIRRGMFTKEEYLKAVNDRKVPYLSCVKVPGIELAEAYPLKAVLEKFKVPYFRNTVSYMIAYALLQENLRSLSLYGIAQMATHEYIQEKASVEFWLGMAMGMGIAVNVETPSLLLHNGSDYPYGYLKTLKQLKEEGKI